ncbi:MAG: hypothetical protein ACXVCH_14400 [Bdellovibrionota bacterium]
MDTDDFVRAFVRGKISAEKLRATPLPMNLSVVIYPMDVAIGVISLWKRPESLQDWATLIDECDFIHLESFDAIDEGALMLGALRSALRDGTITEPALEAASRLSGIPRQ